jgi:uncharacterized protein (TIGR02145 family)
MTPIRLRVALTVVSIVFGSLAGASSRRQSANGQDVAATIPSIRRMADGKDWMTANLNVNASPSYCYDDAESNCRRYGRMYTWGSAQQVCQSLGNRWRLPTDDEWRQLAKHYGGISEDSADKGKAAFTALVSGGSSGFNAVLGGNRSAGQYARLEAHGFYWTASENDSRTAPFYNFGRGGPGVHRQPLGEKDMAISVRCIR